MAGIPGPLGRGTAYLPSVCWAALLLWVGGQPDLPAPSISSFDKVSHFLAYGVLGVSAGLGWWRAGRWPRRGWLLLAALALAASDELRQAGVPERTAEIGDWIADAAGFAVALLVTTRSAAAVRARRRSAPREYTGT